MKREIKELAENTIVSCLTSALNSNDEDEKEANIEQATELIDRVITIEKDEKDALDKEERRKLEKEKIESSNQIEKYKRIRTFGEYAFEITKVAVPVIIGSLATIGMAHYMGELDEKGVIKDRNRWNLIKLPHFMK